MTRPTPGSGAARRTRCPRCSRPVLRQLVGRTAALDVTADDEPLTAAEARRRRRPDRLDWCLRTTKAGADLRWLDRAHPVTCPHPHVVDHVCTAPPVPDRPARRRSSRSVPAGQLTL